MFGFLQGEDECFGEFGVAGARQMQRHFGVMLRALNSPGTRTFLGIEYTGDPESAVEPVPAERVKNLADFTRWTFGDDSGRGAIISDSRQLTDWGRILQSDEAIQYLRNDDTPTFGKALARSLDSILLEDVISAMEEVIERLESLQDPLEKHRTNGDVRALVDRCVDASIALKKTLGDLP